MSVRTLATGVAALSLTAAALVLPATAALAQPADRCANAGGQNAQGNGPGGNGYGAQGTEEGVSNEEARRGEQQRATSGCREFAPGQRVAFGVESTYQALGTTTASQFGEATATFTIPSNLENGRHHVVFTGQAFEGGGQKTVRVPFTVVGGAVAGGRGGQLPRTGSDDLVAIALGGSALVALGGGMVVVARRRSEATPAGLA